MDKENIPQNPGSESAFSGTSRVPNPNLPLEVLSRAYLIRATGKLRFDLWKPSLEKRSGVKLNEGRMYQISGWVDGVKFQSRHLARSGHHVYVFVNGGAGVAPGEPCSLVVEALEEKRKFTVVAGRHGPKVNLSEPALKGPGVPTAESGVVELRVKKPSESVRRVYARWDPVWGSMELHLGSAGFAVGDEVEVVGGRRYDVKTFVEDYRAHRMRELANFELELENGTLAAEVDEKRVTVERHWLTAHGLKVALKLELGRDRKLVKVVFDGGSVEARLGNSDSILELGAAEGGADVRYLRRAGQTYVMRLTEKPSPTAFDHLGWLAGKVRVVERPPGLQGIYGLEMSEVRGWVREKLNGTRKDSAYVRLRGDIGEEIVKNALRDLRVELLYDHPWSALPPRSGSLRHGPDLMARCLDSGRAVYIEVKWWEDVFEAFKRGSERVRQYVRSTPTWKSTKLDGGYIAALDWKLTRTARLWVERVV